MPQTRYGLSGRVLLLDPAQIVFIKHRESVVNGLRRVALWVSIVHARGSGRKNCALGCLSACPPFAARNLFWTPDICGCRGLGGSSMGCVRRKRGGH